MTTFEQLSQCGSISLQSAGALLLVVCAFKIYKMNIHTLSRCFGENNGLELETINTGSSRNLPFTTTRRDDRAMKGTVV
jgi:hypothetical protein